MAKREFERVRIQDAEILVGRMLAQGDDCGADAIRRLMGHCLDANVVEQVRVQYAEFLAALNEDQGMAWVLGKKMDMEAA